MEQGSGGYDAGLAVGVVTGEVSTILAGIILEIVWNCRNE
jgi:hypothetical protein